MKKLILLIVGLTGIAMFILIRVGGADSAPPSALASGISGTSIKEQLSPLGGNVLWVWEHENNTKKYSAYDSVTDEIKELIPGQGYWVRVREGQVVNLDGNPYCLEEGLNLIGWGSRSDSLGVSVEEAFASLGDNLVRVFGYDEHRRKFEMFDPVHLGASDLETLRPGKGYWVRVGQDQVLTYGTYTYQLYAGANLIGWR